MLKKLLFAGLVMIAVRASADEGQKVASKIQKVIVFLNGAQITRTASATVSPGTSTLVFEGISPYIDQQSIQLQANGDFTILSVKWERNFLNEQVKEKEITELQAKERALQSRLDAENNLLSVNQEEENMLLKNQVVTGQNASLDVLKLKQALDFQTERLTGIRKKKIEINAAIFTIDSLRQKYSQQIIAISGGGSSETSNILVTVSSKTTVDADFNLSYVANNARWYPSYDIRAKDVNSPISIAYKANVTQNTGEDWKNIHLTLSTGNPAVSGVKPELNPYYVSFPDIVTSGVGLKVQEKSLGFSTAEVYKSDIGLEGKVSGLQVRVNGKDFLKSNAQYVNVNQTENQTNVEFAIALPYSVPSDGKQYTVEINQAELKADYTYAVAPKLNTSVFLSASIADWSKYNFLPGEANLFFQGTFIGKSQLNTDNTSDTLKLSLGVDKNIVVTRTLQKELTQRQSIGSNQKDTRDWEIEIRNRKDQSINLLVEDQVPVSQNTAIEVENQELSGGRLDPTTGKITWALKLKPQDDKKLELKYQVKYPKNQPINIE